jgi:outer membrane receptor protein involved in Fe transport
MDDVKIGDAAQFTTYLGATYFVSDAFSFDIDWLSFDGLYGDFDVTDSVFSSADNDGAIKLPAYNIIGLGLTYKTELFGNRFQIRANINNLFDEEYISQANTNVDAAPGDRTWNGVNVANEVYFGYGTTYNVRLKYSF